MPLFSKVRDIFKSSASVKRKKVYHNVLLRNPEEVWRIIGELGDGAYGKVYKAENILNGALAALKKVALEEEEDLDNFMVEIDILAECRHNNVVALLEAYHWDCYLWMYLEYCDGGAVDTIMVDLDRPLTEPQIAYICRHLCQALEYVHQEKVIHRDIKAGNVLLTMDGGVKLADFGVSAKNKNTLDKRGTFIGTPYWLAPEVIKCETFIDSNYDYKADIWSLGICLIEFAQMDPPNHEVSPLRVLLKIQKSEPPKLDYASKFSSEFNAFLAECLIKEPTDRPSATDLLKHPFISGPQNAKHIIALLIEYHAEVVEEDVEVECDHRSSRLSIDSEEQSSINQDVSSASSDHNHSSRGGGGHKEVSPTGVNERRAPKGPAPPPPFQQPFMAVARKGPAPAVPLPLSKHAAGKHRDSAVPVTPKDPATTPPSITPHTPPSTAHVTPRLPSSITNKTTSPRTPPPASTSVKSSPDAPVKSVSTISPTSISDKSISSAVASSTPVPCLSTSFKSASTPHDAPSPITSTPIKERKDEGRVVGKHEREVADSDESVSASALTITSDVLEAKISPPATASVDDDSDVVIVVGNIGECVVVSGGVSDSSSTVVASVSTVIPADFTVTSVSTSSEHKVGDVSITTEQVGNVTVTTEQAGEVTITSEQADGTVTTERECDVTVTTEQVEVIASTEDHQNSKESRVSVTTVNEGPLVVVEQVNDGPLIVVEPVDHIDLVASNETSSRSVLETQKLKENEKGNNISESTLSENSRTIVSIDESSTIDVNVSDTNVDRITESSRQLSPMRELLQPFESLPLQSPDDTQIVHSDTKSPTLTDITTSSNIEYTPGNRKAAESRQRIPDSPIPPPDVSITPLTSAEELSPLGVSLAGQQPSSLDPPPQIIASISSEGTLIVRTPSPVLPLPALPKQEDQASVTYSGPGIVESPTSSPSHSPRDPSQPSEDVRDTSSSTKPEDEDEDEDEGEGWGAAEAAAVQLLEEALHDHTATSASSANDSATDLDVATTPVHSTAAAAAAAAEKAALEEQHRHQQQELKDRQKQELKNRQQQQELKEQQQQQQQQQQELKQRQQQKLKDRQQQKLKDRQQQELKDRQQQQEQAVAEVVVVAGSAVPATAGGRGGEVVISNSSILQGESNTDDETLPRYSSEMADQYNEYNEQLQQAATSPASPNQHISVVSVAEGARQGRGSRDPRISAPDRLVTVGPANNSTVRPTTLQDRLMTIEGTTTGDTDVDSDLSTTTSTTTTTNRDDGTSPTTDSGGSPASPLPPAAAAGRLVNGGLCGARAAQLEDRSDSDSISTVSSEKENSKPRRRGSTSEEEVVLRRPPRTSITDTSTASDASSAATTATAASAVPVEDSGGMSLMRPLDKNRHNKQQQNLRNGRTKEENDSLALRRKTRKRTRKFMIDGVVVTTTTSKVIYGDDEECGVLSSGHLERKQELRELKVLQKLEQKQFQELGVKASAARVDQERKFDAEKTQLLRSYDGDIEVLNRSQKQQVERTEAQQEVELKSVSKKLRGDQEKDLRLFREELRTELKLLKQEVDLMHKDLRKEVLRSRKEQLEADQTEREKSFLDRLNQTHETSMKRLSEEHRSRVALLERQFLQKKHQLLRAREAALWELEERHLHDRHQLAKRQLKDIFFLQRHQMLLRHDKELEQVRRQNTNREEELVKRQQVERRHLPKRIRQEMKARELMFRESMRISTSSLMLHQDHQHDEKERIRKFQECEKRRYEAEKKRGEQKHRRQLEELQASTETHAKELELLQNEKRKMLMEHETHKLKGQEEEYQRELKEWKNNLKPRKQRLEEEFEQQLIEQEQFYGAYLCQNLIVTSEYTTVATQ